MSLEFDLSAATEKGLSGWGLAASPKVTAAIAKALKRTVRWLRAEGIKRAARAVGIVQAPLRSRFRIYQHGQTIKFWVGLLHLQASEAGQPVQTAAGVQVRCRSFDGAFYKAVYGSRPKVYIRERRNRRAQHPIYTRSGARKKGAPVIQSNLKGRFPVQTVGFSVHETLKETLLALEHDLNERYLAFLNDELARVAF